MKWICKFFGIFDIGYACWLSVHDKPIEVIFAFVLFGSFVFAFGDVL